MNEPDHYRILGVSPEATPAGLRAAWRRRLHQTHPDTGGDPDEFRAVQTAWETLSDPARRKEYDLGRFGRRAAKKYGRAAARPSHRPRRTPTPPRTRPAPPGTALIAVPWYARLRHRRPGLRPSVWTETAILLTGLALWAAAGTAFCLAAFATAAPLPVRALAIPAVMAAGVIVLAACTRIRGAAIDTPPKTPKARLMFAGLAAIGIVWAAEPGRALGWWLALFTLTTALLPWPAKRARWAFRLRRAVKPALRRYNAFGPAGTRARADRPTSHLLRELLANLPAARLFVSLPTPAGRIPHAIVCGRRLALLCPPVARDPGDVDVNAMPQAVEALARALPDVTVHGWVLWPTLPDHGPASLDAAVAEVSVNTAAADIGRWLADQPPRYDLPTLQALRLRLAVPPPRPPTPAPARA